MADNYLEKKMEDLRSGRNNSSHRSPSPYNRKGVFAIPFPPQRVLIDMPASETRLILIRSFIKTGSKVAVIENNKALAKALAHDEGVRVYSAQKEKEILVDLYDEWQKVTVIICTSNRLYYVAEAWRERFEFFHIPSLYKPRLISIKEEGEDSSPISLSKYEVSSNEILVSKGSLNKPEIADRSSNLCLFLCAPGNEYLRNYSFRLHPLKFLNVRAAYF